MSHPQGLWFWRIQLGIPATLITHCTESHCPVRNKCHVLISHWHRTALTRTGRYLRPRKANTALPNCHLPLGQCPQAYLEHRSSQPYAMTSSCQLLDLANTAVNTTQKKKCNIETIIFTLLAVNDCEERRNDCFNISFLFWVVLTTGFAKSSSWQEEFMV